MSEKAARPPNHVLRFVAFAVAPSAIVAAGLFAYWPSIYLTLPIAFPFSAYNFSTGKNGWSVDQEHHLQTVLAVSYALGTALVSVFLSRRLSRPDAVIVFFALTLGLALLFHVVAAMLGATYQYGTPT